MEVFFQQSILYETFFILMYCILSVYPATHITPDFQRADAVLDDSSNYKVD